LSGGFSEYIVLAPGTAVVRLPSELSLEAACPLSCATSTIAAAIRLLRVRASDEVLVVGAGLLGLTSCAMASDLGARRIVCVDMDANRAQKSRSFGAHHAYIPQQSDSSFRDKAPPHGFDIAIECTGSNQATSMAFESLRIGGRLGLVGAVFPTPELPLAMERIVRRQLLVQGIHNYAPEDLVAAVAFMARVHQRFPFAQLVGPSFPLKRIDAAVDAARNPSHIRVCVRPDQPA
jgi:alcohol dehydrogenase